MRDRVMCHLFGCQEDAGGCGRCLRCNMYSGDPEFIEVGMLPSLWLWPKWWALGLWRLVVGRKCEVCGRRYWRGYSNWCCSETCGRKWVPF